MNYLMPECSRLIILFLVILTFCILLNLIPTYVPLEFLIFYHSSKLLYVILGIKSIFDKVTSWPQLISKLLVPSACLHAASDWLHTFLHIRCFYLALLLLPSASQWPVTT